MVRRIIEERISFLTSKIAVAAEAGKHVSDGDHGLTAAETGKHDNDDGQGTHTTPCTVLVPARPYFSLACPRVVLGLACGSLCQHGRFRRAQRAVPLRPAPIVPACPSIVDENNLSACMPAPLFLFRKASEN